LRNPSENHDLQLEHAPPDESWSGGAINLPEERPETALRGDPSQRKWMLIGVGGSGLLTAIAVLLMTHDANRIQAADQQAVEPVPVEQQVEPAVVEAAPVEPAPVEPSPAARKKSKSHEKPTLAATSRAAASAPAPTKKAPPVPVIPSTDQPATPAAADKPSPAAPASKPAPAVTPTLPTEQPSDDGPAAELPDVEGWDDADAAVEQDEPAVEAAAPSGLADVAS
jgi:hypothetical protein